MTHSKKLLLITLSALASLSSVAHAQPDLSTGGYVNELQTMEMMSMLDANDNHMVSKEEFNSYYNKLFDALNKNKDDSLDENEWIGNVMDTKTSLGTGGYFTELRTKKVMSAMDSNANNKVSRKEFLSLHETIFSKMDAKSEGEVDPQNWLRRQTHN